MPDDDDSLLSQDEIDEILKSLAQPANDAGLAGPGPEGGASLSPVKAGGETGGDTHEAGWRSAQRDGAADAQPKAPAASPRALKAWQDANPQFGRLLGVRVRCTVEMGGAHLELGKLLGYGPSMHLFLDQKVDEPLTLRVNGVPFARGVVVKVQGKYGIKISEVIARAGQGRARGGR